MQRIGYRDREKEMHHSKKEVRIAFQSANTNGLITTKDIIPYQDVFIKSIYWLSLFILQTTLQAICGDCDREHLRACVLCMYGDVSAWLLLFNRCVIEQPILVACANELKLKVAYCSECVKRRSMHFSAFLLLVHIASKT